MHTLHIVFTGTPTLVGFCIRHILDSKFNHCSIAFDCDFDNMYSFRRSFKYNLLSGEFGTENLEAMKDGRDIPVEILTYSITDEQYEEITGYLSELSSYKHLVYNYPALFLLLFGKGIDDNKHMLCSTFTAYVYNLVYPLKDKYYLYTPSRLNEELMCG